MSAGPQTVSVELEWLTELGEMLRELAAALERDRYPHTVRALLSRSMEIARLTEPVVPMTAEHEADEAGLRG